MREDGKRKIERVSKRECVCEREREVLTLRLNTDVKKLWLSVGWSTCFYTAIEITVHTCIRPFEKV